MTAPPGTSEPPFVGAGRHAVVDGLLAAYDAVNHGEGPLWVVLEATSGTGKTRLARELYARLAAERQHSGAYWPPSILGTTADDDVSARRKRVHPVVEHLPGTLPAFCWWGVAASVRNGEPSSALAADVGQLEAHAPYLDDTWRRLASFSERNAGWWRQPLSEVSEEVVTEVAGRAVEAALGSAVPGLGLAVSLVQTLRDQRVKARERTARLEGTALVQADATDLLDRTVATLTRLGRPGLPIVLLVEDAHLADALLAELLGRLVESDAAVLLLTTQWPGHAEANPHLSAALGLRPDRVVVAAAGAEALPAPFPPGASLDPLPAGDRAQIVRHYYPRADPDTLERLVARWTNPLALELFCLLGRYRDRFPDGDLRLPQSEVDRLPRTVEDLYRDLWRELPGDVRRALTLASLGIPAAIDPATSSDLAWHQPLLVRTLAAARVAPADDVSRTLDQAPTTRAWARMVDDALRRFHELDQLRIAHDDDEFLFDSDREEFRAALAAEVAGVLERAELDGEEKAHAARLALALHTQGHGTDATALLASAVLLLALSDQPRELAYRTAVAERALALGPDGSWAGRTVRAEHARCLALAGRHDLALAAFEALLAEVREDADPDPDVIRRIRQERSVLLLEIGRVEEALLEAEAVLRLTELGGDADDQLHVQANLAAALAMAGRYREALDRWREVLAGRTVLSGPEDPATVYALLQVADVLVLLSRPQEALEVLGDVVDRTTAALGPEHPTTLEAHKEMALTLAAAGRLEEALALRTRLAEETVALFGPRHPSAIFARADRAVSLEVMGRTPEAVAEYEALLTVVTSTFGHEHRHALKVTAFLARALLQDDPARAEALVEEALPRAVALRGATNPETLHLKDLRARAASMRGDLERGLELARALWGEYADLAPDHPTRDAVQANLAWHLRRTDRHAEAAEVDRRVLAEADAVLGEAHPDAVRAAWALGGDLRAAGRHDECVAVLRDLVRRADEHDLEGLDLEARWELTVSLTDDARPGEALSVLEDLCDLIERRFGPDDPRLRSMPEAVEALRGAQRELDREAQG